MGNDNCSIRDVCPSELFAPDRRKIFSGGTASNEQQEILKTIEQNIRQEEELMRKAQSVAQQGKIAKVTFDGSAEYEGEFKNDIKHGFGVQKWVDGSKYEGQWFEGKAKGLGKFHYANGDYYQGEFQNDKQHGQGTLFHSSGAKYSGKWVNGIPFGHGSYVWLNGNAFEGEFRAGKKNGQGKFTWED